MLFHHKVRRNRDGRSDCVPAAPSYGSSATSCELCYTHPAARIDEIRTLDHEIFSQSPMEVHKLQACLHGRPHISHRSHICRIFNFLHPRVRFSFSFWYPCELCNRARNSRLWKAIYDDWRGRPRKNADEWEEIWEDLHLGGHFLFQCKMPNRCKHA